VPTNKILLFLSQFRKWDGLILRPGALLDDAIHQSPVFGWFARLWVRWFLGWEIVTCAYVDLNPVRAKLVDATKDYKWSGYGEAVGGKEVARRGMAAGDEG
jgi:hypothetical protein